MFESLSNEDLFTLLESESFKDAALLPQQKTAALFATAKRNIPVLHRNGKTIQSIFSALTDAPSYPLLILWSVVGLVSLKIIALTILTCGVGIAMLGIGGLYYVATYRELHKEAQKTNRQFHLDEIKLLCAHELVRRQRQQLQLFELSLQQIDEISVSVAAPVIRPRPRKSAATLLPKLKTAASAALTISTTLFSTYYFGMGAIALAFSATLLGGAMMGPIGLGIALVVALGIGVFFGYQQYKISQNAKQVKNMQKQKAAEIETKMELCFELQVALRNQQALAHKAKPVRLKTLHQRPVQRSHVELIDKPYKSANPQFLLLNKRLGKRPKAGKKQKNTPEFKVKFG